MGKRSGAYRILVRKHEGRIHHLEDPGVDGRIILKWTGSIWLRTRTCGGLL